MKSVTLLSKMYDLGITPSRGKPRVSNDNAFSESLFRTLKYCPNGHRKDLPVWMMPGAGSGTLCAGTTMSIDASAQHPEQWAGRPRNWQPVGNAQPGKAGGATEKGSVKIGLRDNYVDKYRLFDQLNLVLSDVMLL